MHFPLGDCHSIFFIHISFVECFNPGPIANGYLVGDSSGRRYPCGSTAQYGCNTNYRLRNQWAYRTCEANNRWSAAPSCVYSMYYIQKAYPQYASFKSVLVPVLNVCKFLNRQNFGTTRLCINL